MKNVNDAAWVWTLVSIINLDTADNTSCCSMSA